LCCPCNRFEQIFYHYRYYDKGKVDEAPSFEYGQTYGSHRPHDINTGTDDITARNYDRSTTYDDVTTRRSPARR